MRCLVNVTGDSADVGRGTAAGHEFLFARLGPLQPQGLDFTLLDHDLAIKLVTIGAISHRGCCLLVRDDTLTPVARQSVKVEA